MKRLLFATLVVVTMLLLAGDAFCIGIFGSYWRAEDAEAGYGLGVKHKFDLIAFTAVDVRATWLSYKDWGMTYLNLFPLEATALARLRFLYGGLGVGYYIFGSSEIDLDNAGGWYILAGLELNAGGTGLFGELKWSFLETKYGSNDVNLDGFGVNIGLLFNW